MPSPIGHALGGALLGGLVAGQPPAPARPRWREAVVFSALGLAADLDFLVGQHSQYTHSVAAAAVVGVIALAATRGRARWALAAAVAYASHILLDALGHDTTPPIGVLAFWPFSQQFYQTDLHLFMAISRRYWLPGFLAHNLMAVAWELVVLGPLTALVWWRRRRNNGN
jgi:membrane-bound metal-dependent hydrolase YbcI (DUF457 family)